MKNFLKIDLYSFNILLGIITPIMGYLLLNKYFTLLIETHSISWLLSLEFLHVMSIIFCYSFPLAWFGSKLHELFKSPEVDVSLGLVLVPFIFLPFGLILLMVLAKANFIGVIVLAVATLISYIRSYMPVLQKVRVKK